MSFCSSSKVLALIALTNYDQQTFLPPFQTVHHGDKHCASRGGNLSPLSEMSISLKKMVVLVWWATPF